MYNFSKHNIFSRIKESENSFLVNLLNGSADILDPAEADYFVKLMQGAEVPETFSNMLIEKGYIVDVDEEKRLYRNKYLEFIDNRDEEEVQLFFVPNYSCNFACNYCYQDKYNYPRELLTKDIIDSFFYYVSIEFAGRKSYITIFGGEPLQNSPYQREMLSYFLQKARKAELEICLVTNGFTLLEYIDILKLADIREIQVTLDGVGETHDSRRFLKGGGATFEKIVDGIDACLSRNFPVNLRMVADMDNIDSLPELAKFAIDKGWTVNPGFKTQLGRNYELHHCQSVSEKLFSRISLYEHIYELTKKHPHILEFYKPAYSVSKFLAENSSLPDPLFDACPACKTEWAFDYTGTIYSCTATVGKADESLGSFYPEVVKNTELIEEWERRDVTEISACKSCNLQLACGGGCGSVAKNISGNICSTDCRPVTELLEIGFASFFNTETK